MGEAVYSKMTWEYPQKDGSTLLDHVNQIRNNPKTSNPDLSCYPDPPEVPYGGEYVWDLFWMIREGVGSNGFSPSPISYLELLSFSHLTGTPLSAFTVKAIRHMDSRWLEYISDSRKKEG